MDTLTTLRRPNRTGGEFLLIDAATAHTLLDVAETTHDVVAVRNDIRLAHETLHSMNRYLGTLDMDASLRAVIEMSRDRLERRLSSMQRRFAVT